MAEVTFEEVSEGLSSVSSPKELSNASKFASIHCLAAYMTSCSMGLMLRMKWKRGRGVFGGKQCESSSEQGMIVEGSRRRRGLFLQADVRSVSYVFKWSGYIAYALTEPLVVLVESLALAI